MGVHLLVEIGLFLFLLFAGLGVMLVGVGILKWGGNPPIFNGV